MVADSSDKPNIVVLSGPTACGKSALAIELARNLSAEIINADSVQVYRGFDIGSGKPSAEQLGCIPHHLYSYISPEQHFDAQVFCRDVDSVIADLSNRQRLPLVVGGTGMYISSLLGGLVDVSELDPDVLQTIEVRELELSKHIGPAADAKAELGRVMHDWLSAVDRNSAERIKATDLSRIRRALAVKLSTGSSLAELQDSHKHSEQPYRALVITLLPSRQLLYPRINQRVEQMLSVGLVAEVRDLLSVHSPTCRAFGAIGYRHACQFLSGDISEAEMLELLKRDTRRFAKRQFTWWRNQPLSLGWEVIDFTLGRNLGLVEKEAELEPAWWNKIQAELALRLPRVITDYFAKASAETGKSIAFLPIGY